MRAKEDFITQLDPSSQILLSRSDMSHLEKLQPGKKSIGKSRLWRKFNASEKKIKKILVNAGKGTKISLNSTGAIFQMKRFIFSMG